ncbi:Trihelix transcription factor GTL2 [Raphanus sativus]|uniref:Trihelix transcription factor GTL2-like n=1 Tax=Raphanus sativus TaxID=3726 RepID=A0A9W3BYS2_RAPSA|nr:trihelix transcription factor GTL2-like [Raphanus sativus]KAJ4888027.1 Trihelix transcription factor GTL2 [Raphanus sativus]
MFDGGVPEQIQQFIASPQPPPPPHQPATESSLPFPVSFASFNSNHQAQHMLSLDSRKIIHHHHHDIKDGGVTSQWIGHTDHDGEDHRLFHHHPWCSDEVLALLRFRSTVENWFPEFTWELTSRKLAEVGFKRSPQECREKFEEEERRYFNSNNANDHHISSYNNKGNYRMFSEVEEFYHHGHNDDEHVPSEVGDNQNKSNNSLEGKGNVEETGQDLLDDKRDHQGQVEESSMGNKVTTVDNVGNHEDDGKSSSSSLNLKIMRDKKKRKRKKKKKRFVVLTGFFEGVVSNMIAQQEEMHKKLLGDMVKKEEEKVAREEAWKKQEMERLNKEVEIRANEQAMASDRNTSIIKFISKFTDHDSHDYGNYKVHSPSPSQDLSSLVLPKTQGITECQTSSALLPRTLTSDYSISLQTNDIPLDPISTKTLKTKTQNIKPPKSDDTSDISKRWPRDEVLALINIRRSISTMNDDEHHKDGISLSSSSPKAVSLWERISKKMLESGYKRSAKRCKEKWENINKYFKKTKDVNKKRPLDSRTCPYFHQLTALYSQPFTGTTTTATNTSTGELETRVGSGDHDDIPAAMHLDANGAGKKNSVQFSGFDLAFE